MLKEKMKKAMQEGDLLQVALLLHTYPKDSDSLGELLLAACEMGFKYIDIFLDQGADVNYASKESPDITPQYWYTTPLMHACLRGYTEIVNVLLDCGADVNMKDNDGESALHDASKKNYLEIVKILVEKGADINHQDDDGYTPLHNACTFGGLEVVEFLLSKGADPSISTSFFETAASLAKLSRFFVVAELVEQYTTQTHV